VRIKSKKLTTVAALLMSCFFKLLFTTLRVRILSVADDAPPYFKDRTRCFVYPVWHDSMVVPIFFRRQPATVALVGAHNDGSYVSTVLKSVGIRSVRGSSSRGGVKALRQLLAETEGAHIVLTPDGPRGPRRQLKPGLAFLASRTGKVVIPTAFAADQEWRPQGKWTDLMIPKPFSRVFALLGQPIEIPRKASKEQLDQYNDLIQTAMDRLNELVEQVARGEIDGEAAIDIAAQQSSTLPGDEQAGQIAA
jgi:lysophospholipid acyltransferase (LPLAT)-like uncharacterized protein